MLGTGHFDCACLHQNESEIGDALREKIEEGVVKQEDLFTISKIENHPYLLQEELIKLCQSKGISIIAYCPLGAPNWPCALGRRQRAIQLLGTFIQLFDFESAEEEMETFLAFKKRYRICALSECNHKDYPFLEDQHRHHLQIL